MKILLVDDDAALATVFETALKKENFEVIVVTDGKGALEKVQTEKPDLILLDQILPDISGNDVLRTLKQDPLTRDIPVAMLSNFGQNELVQDALKNEAVDYILKYQIEPKDLVAKVKELTRQSQTPTTQ